MESRGCSLAVYAGCSLGQYYLRTVIGSSAREQCGRLFETLSTKLRTNVCGRSRGYLCLCFWAIDLQQRTTESMLYYDIFVLGGRSVAEAQGHGATMTWLEQQATQPLKAVHRQQVPQKDARSPNMLVIAEVSGVMVIDFEPSYSRRLGDLE